ncbi:hypothetical protein DSO57_1030365 [Entomophthora muscae]|uniref:Uncharacterized protein n=1 Tax=Entomophthora muscae TaxID=34485 RepID=A0ACC2TZI7_9FUNG|nr:hypothetical protein DSO57_1030365 [Entomophthora muscae]
MGHSTVSSSVVKSAEYINATSQHVSINPSGVKHAVKTLQEARKSGTPFNFDDWHSHPLNPSLDADPEYILSWIMVVDALNFSFWSDLEVGLDATSHDAMDYLRDNKYGVYYREALYQGYWALPALVNRALDAGVPLLDFSRASVMSDSELTAIFFSGHSSVESYPPLVELRVKVIKETALTMVDKFGGSMKNLISQAKNSATTFVEIVTSNFPSFNDTSKFMGKDVVLHKRAQILVADIWACFKGQSFGLFNDIDQVTMFADYRVPQALVYLGVLEYSQELLSKLKSPDPHLASGDPMEVEIRGNSIWAVELICQKLKPSPSDNPSAADQSLTAYSSSQWNAILIDFYLWEFAKFNSDALSHIPIHRTRSCFY